MSKIYEQVYWITLRDRKDRQQFFGRNLAELGHEPTVRLLGIDPTKLSLKTDLNSPVYAKTLANDRMIGSYLSHLFAVKTVTMNPKNTLILEDDAELCAGFSARLEAVMKGIPSDWEVVHLGGLKDDGTPEDGCWAYLLRGESAHKVEKILETRTCSIDDTFKQMRDQQQVRFYHATNALVRHGFNDVVTDISVPQFIYNKRRLKNNADLSFSQYGEDLFIDKFFEGSATGRFLEIGAMDGIKDSNCHRLALHGWTGVCVEPNPHIFVRLLSNYAPTHPEIPTIVCLNALVMGSSSIRTLHLNTDGLTTACAEMFSELHKRVVYYGHCHTASVTPSLLKQTYGTGFDFVTVDAEGTDLEILRSPGTKELLADTRLICVEKDMPGRPHDDAYTAALTAACAECGLGTLVHETIGNVLLAR